MARYYIKNKQKTTIATQTIYVFISIVKLQRYALESWEFFLLKTTKQE